MSFGPSFPQIELYNLIRAHHPDAQLEYQLGNRRLDIAIPSKRLDIEYDGELYHQDALSDARRDLEVISKGWRVVRIRKQDLQYLRSNPLAIRWI